MNDELRLYTFTLYQLSPIQQGIQAGHAAVELGMRCYKNQMTLRSGTDFKTYYDWATNWKTMVCLNGGDLHELCELRSFLNSVQNPLPWVPFYESEDSLGGILTSIAIILPARIFLTAEAARKKIPLEPEEDPFTEWEIELIDRLSKASLAR
jgi:hypothetical protein